MDALRRREIRAKPRGLSDRSAGGQKTGVIPEHDEEGAVR